MNAVDAYLSCFCIGLALCVLSFFGGMVHMHPGPHGFHLHWNGGHGGHGKSIGFFNAFTLTAFLCWFGGVGYLLTKQHSVTAILVLLCATGAGLIAASCIFLFLVKVLLPHERALLPEDTDMRGVLARVTGQIQPGRMGEVIFTLNGTRRSVAAQSETGESIQKAALVIVTSYSRGIALVHQCTELEEIDQGILSDSGRVSVS